MRWHVPRRGDRGSPRGAGATRASSSGTRGGLGARRFCRPPPACRVRAGVGGSHASRPRGIGGRERPEARATRRCRHVPARVPPSPGAGGGAARAARARSPPPCVPTEGHGPSGPESVLSPHRSTLFHRGLLGPVVNKHLTPHAQRRGGGVPRLLQRVVGCGIGMVRRHR